MKLKQLQQEAEKTSLEAFPNVAISESGQGIETLYNKNLPMKNVPGVENSLAENAVVNDAPKQQSKEQIISNPNVQDKTLEQTIPEVNKQAQDVPAATDQTQVVFEVKKNHEDASTVRDTLQGDVMNADQQQVEDQFRIEFPSSDIREDVEKQFEHISGTGHPSAEEIAARKIAKKELKKELKKKTDVSVNPPHSDSSVFVDLQEIVHSKDRVRPLGESPKQIPLAQQIKPLQLGEAVSQSLAHSSSTKTTDFQNDESLPPKIASYVGTQQTIVELPDPSYSSSRIQSDESSKSKLASYVGTHQGTTLFQNAPIVELPDPRKFREPMLPT